MKAAPADSNPGSIELLIFNHEMQEYTTEGTFREITSFQHRRQTKHPSRHVISQGSDQRIQTKEV